MTTSNHRKQVLVTIGLPVFNAKPYIELALRSVFAQTLHDWELIIIDDGSTDGSVDVLRTLDDDRIRVIADGQHLGLGARLNQIVGHARGSYTARMDADDLMHPQRLQSQLDYLMLHPEVDVVGSSMLVLDHGLVPAGMRSLPATHAQICARPLRGFLIAHATLFGRSKWFASHPYDESLCGCEDWGLFLSSFRESTFANITEPLYFYREVESYSLAKYVKAKINAARFLWRYARPYYGLAEALLAMLAQYARAAIYRVAGLLGMDRYLLRTRNQPLGPGLLELAQAVQQVLATALPRDASLQEPGIRR